MADKEKETNTTPTNSVKSVKQNNKNSKQKQKNAKPKRSLGKMAKETISELKKVSWPTFPKVVKQTGVVIAVVLAFAVVLLGFDTLFSFLYNLLVKAIS